MMMLISFLYIHIKLNKTRNALYFLSAPLNFYRHWWRLIRRQKAKRMLTKLVSINVTYDTLSHIKENHKYTIFPLQFIFISFFSTSRNWRWWKRQGIEHTHKWQWQFLCTIKLTVSVLDFCLFVAAWKGPQKCATTSANSPWKFMCKKGSNEIFIKISTLIETANKSLLAHSHRQSVLTLENSDLFWDLRNYNFMDFVTC